jgi:hypothetical protein
MKLDLLGIFIISNQNTKVEVWALNVLICCSFYGCIHSMLSSNSVYCRVMHTYFCFVMYQTTCGMVDQDDITFFQHRDDKEVCRHLDA